MRTSTALLGLAAALAAGGCGGKKGEPKPAAKGPDPQAEVSKLASEAAPAVNGLVPEQLKANLEFTAAVADDKRAVALQPKGWQPGAEDAALRPPEEADLGFMTAYSVRSNCDGDCAPKKWAEVADRVELARLRGPDFTVVKDETLPEGRLVVAKTTDRTYVTAVFWKEGGKRYFVCAATLDLEVAGAAPAFEEACKRTRILSWD